MYLSGIGGGFPASFIKVYFNFANLVINFASYIWPSITIIVHTYIQLNFVQERKVLGRGCPPGPFLVRFAYNVNLSYYFSASILKL